MAYIADYFYSKFLFAVLVVHVAHEILNRRITTVVDLSHVEITTLVVGEGASQEVMELAV